ncbi:hypothetical protein Patl1_12425 [Pistacia atlantica]|uniref:Uncharacterized protein n=1 Tax=Pistacia atlantica TaxID=434234 RepID=A0ACC1A2U9_9ROSI|nr:hypothetical protein Patl1_12425 [Pistacia atlantica]
MTFLLSIIFFLLLPYSKREITLLETTTRMLMNSINPHLAA